MGKLGEILDRRYAAQQSEMAMRYAEEVKNTYGEMRAWRHDFKNHLITMETLLSQGETDRLSAYIRALSGEMNKVDALVRTQNPLVDAVLNCKLSYARSRGIPVDAKVVAPPALPIGDTALCVILTNLLDNAVEACLRAPEGETRFMRVYMNVFEEQFYISVSNSAYQKPGVIGGRYRSIKGASHGWGILRVDRAAREVGGHVNRQYEDGIFAPEVLLPLS